ncbi:unnamed protein product [Xylocopa violacea]|uniref:Uncharacterized protein n=1 Tax=Xylocopa violacea TaxID=135666 RepID=A0ABP1P1G1_XYLVO
MEETVKRRNKAPRDAETGNSMADQKDEEQVQEQQRCKKSTFKYYFNRIRYYHYYVAEKVDTLIGVVCMTIIKIYFFLMGWNDQRALQDDEMMNVDDSIQ